MQQQQRGQALVWALLLLAVALPQACARHTSAEIRKDDRSLILVAEVGLSQPRFGSPALLRAPPGPAGP